MSVKISELIKSKKVTLPVSGATLTVLTAVPMELAAKMTGVEQEIDQVYLMLCNQIQSWDITDEDGTTAPITREVIDKLSADDVKYLTQQAFGIPETK